MNLLRVLLLAGIRCYRFLISPVLTALFGPLGMGCRFTPTCSEYAFKAIQQHGAWTGTGLALRRLCRCHPWGDSGHDPVPPRRDPFQAAPSKDSPSRADSIPAEPRRLSITG